MSRSLGVGLVAAGPVTQAIHLPTIASFSGRLHVAHVMDVDLNLAGSVAARYPDARFSTSLTDLLDDPGVDIVVVGSPDRFHAEQLVAICGRGVRAVLCEKPLAVTEAEGQSIVAASRNSGVPIVVGTMHAFDPAWRAALRHWQHIDSPAQLVRCIARLPGNGIFVDAATQLITPSEPPPPMREPAPHEQEATILRRSILGLLIHTIPLVRALVPSVDSVSVAGGFEPFGSRLVLECSETTVELHGLMPGQWEPDWQLHAFSDRHEMAVTFPPSYVMAGSANAVLSDGIEQRAWAFPHNGYHAEWQHVLELATGTTEPLVSVESALADLVFALNIARLAEPLVAVKQ